MDTQVLGMVLKSALQKHWERETSEEGKKSSPPTLSSYVEETIWSKTGFESDCKWLLDNVINGMELAFGTFTICTRDFARFGWLYFNRGISPVSGKQVVPKDWVETSTHIDPKSKHLLPGDRKLSCVPFFGYGYQWWICPKEDDPMAAAEDFMAIGVYGQFVYVNREEGIVIARNAAWSGYNESEDIAKESESQACQLFRAIAKEFKHL